VATTSDLEDAAVERKSALDMIVEIGLDWTCMVSKQSVSRVPNRAVSTAKRTARGGAVACSESQGPAGISICPFVAAASYL